MKHAFFFTIFLLAFSASNYCAAKEKSQSLDMTEFVLKDGINKNKKHKQSKVDRKRAKARSKGTSCKKTKKILHKRGNGQKRRVVR